MSAHRSRRSRIVWGLSILVAAWVALPLASSAAPGRKSFSATIVSSPARVGSGDTVRFTLTLANHADRPLASADLAAASNDHSVHGAFTYLSVASRPLLHGITPRGSTTLAHQVLHLRDLALPPGAYTTLSFTAQAGCEAGPQTWGIRASYTSDPHHMNTPVGPDLASSLTTDISGECGLEFIRQPADAEVGASITDTPLQLGSPIQVSVESESGQRVTEADEPVTLAIANVPPGGTSTLDGTTTVEPVNGIATFCDPNQVPHCVLPSIGAHGQGYTLSASSEESDPAISVPFNVVDDGTVCMDVGRCQVHARGGNTGATVDVLAEPGDLLSVSIGVDQLSCTGYHNTSEVVTYDTTAGSGAVGSLTFDDEVAGRGIQGYFVCFSSSLPFVDRYHHYVPAGGSGILADCSKIHRAPCMVSREFDPGTNYVTLTFRSPPGDPKVVG